MTQPGIKPWSPGPLANTILIRPRNNIGSDDINRIRTEFDNYFEIL